MIQRWFHRVILSRRWATFLVMGLAFLVFGGGSLNLFFVLKANLALLAEHGWAAAMDGGLQQFVELLVVGYASMAAYVIFKACEYRLVHAVCDPPTSHAAAPHEDRDPPR